MPGVRDNGVMGGPALVLASASPRRAALLDQLGVEYTVRAPNIDETPLPDEHPGEHVMRLARAKAEAVGGPNELTLGADTIVALGPELFGKPADADEARTMLRRLSGRPHHVSTGVALHLGAELLGGPSTISTVITTQVTFAPLTDAEIDWYVGTNEWTDKAGAYGIQALGSLFVITIQGNYSNVVGLPIPAVADLLARAGHPWHVHPRRG
jgi:septum formation protein